MNYSLDVQDTAMIVRVDGRVDESSWEEFGKGLHEAVRQAGQSGLASVIIDLSERAATGLGFRREGKTRVRTEVLEWGKREAD